MDEIGKTFSELGKLNEELKSELSGELSKFPSEVPKIVEQADYGGITIYAGGEDVLTMRMLLLQIYPL